MSQLQLDLNVTEVGEDVELMKEEGILILFNNTVPEDLKTIAVIHDGAFHQDIKSGDNMIINGELFRILHVGDKANETLSQLGHATFNFEGETEYDMPGTVYLEKKEIPHIETGSTISFHRL
ncbi:hypothetical protein J18TS1_30330 [Oceanobacillus oncorhynchi subsp. incaldanensis]|uniref:PTS system glucitol/sorbitol-specific transporter subunit IIA n=2 Tax=Oceanobacillus TaxID=182709 RepID=A0A0A1MDF2_9BACI|nr:PTS glucitol/sorbitol transporter subunit IIA [Oceanobacillus oncorhynchi]MDM8099666.1 PTS glucitol/sorbitol transporter subunit IIA [Oceanobacillus oncorhynchi]UUI41881.1 PTS glucitol/sorbitol transporter subunit IIA [Oceanobacillus oncorhynchi]GIO19933.1 hypothetical protein J18TS1_30330 [Oceanobacillus oncorhynchi subsp. incaldanensis]CEI83385.1 PTS system glucitol/sorbitol-specific transporter subunit IIA [Oceanobacillus oncorhynchi]